MALKNKFFILFILIFCMSSSVFASEIPQYNSSYEDNYISVETMRNVVQSVGLDNVFSTDTQLEGLTYQFNLWAEEYSQTQEFSLLNLLFFRDSTRVDNNTYLQFTVTNGTFSNNLPYAYFDINASYKYLFFYNPETETTSTATAYACNTSRYYSYTNPRFTQSYEITSNTIDVENYATAMNTYVVYANTSEFGKKDFFLTSNYEIILDPNLNPDTPSSGDNSGDISGDTPGTTTPNYNEKLDNIQTGIDNVNQNLNNISGELNEINNNLTTVPDISEETISSGDIIGALGFDFAEDPYSNFWLELTTGLGNAFTDDIRSINVKFRENTYKINLDDFSIQLPDILKVFLTTISTVFICWKMLKYWKIIIDNITSGNMDEVLAMNEEERYY